MSSTYPVFEFDKAEWDQHVGTAQDGMMITYEVESTSETTSAGGEGAW